jgi:hypothetical protein
MRRTIGMILVGAALAFGPAGPAQAALTSFSNPSAFAPGVALVTFDEPGLLPNQAFRSVAGVGFERLTTGTLIGEGLGPSIAGAPNSTIPRAFAPTNGTQFLNTINAGGAFASDLRITLPALFGAIAFELVGGGGLGVPDTVTFEVFRGSTSLGTVAGGTVNPRAFAFFGIASDTSFDSLVIRQQPDTRFLLENLRYGALQPAAAVPGPGALPVLAAALFALGLARRAGRNALDRQPARA